MYNVFYLYKRGVEYVNEIESGEINYIQISERIEKRHTRMCFWRMSAKASTNELAKLYAINPSTAAKGINILVEVNFV